jgi:hypothetical protein
MLVKWLSAQVALINPGTQQTLQLQLQNPQRASDLHPNLLRRSSVQVPQQQHLYPLLRKRTHRHPLLLLSHPLLSLSQPLKISLCLKAMPPCKNTPQPPPYHLRPLPQLVPPQETCLIVTGIPQEAPRFCQVGSLAPIIILNQEALLLLALLLLPLLGLVLGLLTKGSCSNSGAGPKG